jgi:purine-binding chemotaxis protein CheW
MNDEHHLVVFSLLGEQYGLPVSSVREIVRYTQPGATAAATGVVVGMINLRGRVLPIVDLSSRLGRTLAITGGTRILVIELAQGPVGLIVDAVDGVMRVPAEQVEPLPVPVGEDGLGDQIAAVGDRLILLLDAERAVGSALPARPAARRRRKTT